VDGFLKSVYFISIGFCQILTNKIHFMPPALFLHHQMRALLQLHSLEFLPLELPLLVLQQFQLLLQELLLLCLLVFL
jgi:hypothetical protein